MSMDSHSVSAIIPLAVLAASAAAKRTQNKLSHASEKKKNCY